MEAALQVLAGVVGTVLATVLTALILRRLGLTKDGTPICAPPPATHAPVVQNPVGARDERAEAEEQPTYRGRREETLRVLFRHGVVAPGTEIEPMPQALPPDGVAVGPDIFRVRIGNPPGREVVWAADGGTYSLSALSNKLSEEYGLLWFKSRTFELWRLIGQQKSLWDLAEGLLEQESQAV